MAVLIVYGYQNLSLRSKYIFFRSMLYVMDKRLCVPDKLIAQTLGTTYLAYRVRKHQVWYLLRTKRRGMLQGERIKLDKEGIMMAKHIFGSYGNLFPLLRSYYLTILESLPQKDMIKAVIKAHENMAF